MAEKPKPNKIKKLAQGQIALAVLKYFKIIVLAYVLVLLAAGYFYVIKPKQAAISQEVESAKEEKSGEKDAMQNYLIRLSRYQREYREISPANRQKINQMLPDSSIIDDLYAYFEALTARRGLSLNSVSINAGGDKADKRGSGNKAAAPANGMASAQVSLMISGTDYNSLLGLLDLLENSLPILDVISLNFSPGEENLSLQLRTYIKNP